MSAFGIVPAETMRDPSISAPARCLLALLSTYADKSGLCFPSRERLAAEMGCSLRTVARLLAELVGANVIARTQPGRQAVALTRVIARGDTSGTSGVSPVAHRTGPVNNTNNEAHLLVGPEQHLGSDYEEKTSAYLTSLDTKEWAPGQSGCPWYGRAPASTTLDELSKWANNSEFWGEPLRYFYDEHDNADAPRWFPL